MANKRDYYEVLGVGKNATDEEIKRAYRKKAKECHPDLHPDDKEAVERFKELNEANEVLSDPQKRARYDQYGFEDPMSGMGGAGNPFGGGFDFGMGDIFDQLFNGGMGSRASRNAGPVKGHDLRYDLQITFDEAAKGCEKKFEIYRNELCETCKGSGAKPGTSPVTCTACKGTGQVRQSMGWMTTVRTCPQCGGAGKTIKEKCASCGGTGRVRKKRTVTIQVPAGSDYGDPPLILYGQGEPGLHGGPNGDLYIVISVKPHKLFKRDGYNLLLDFPVSFTTAALGGDVEVPTLSGPVKYRIPEGTQPGTEFRIKGAGIQRLRSAGKGDLILRIRVEIPRRLTNKQKDLLRQFEETTSDREYDSRKSFMDRVKELFQ